MSTETLLVLRSIDASLKELVGIAKAKRGGGAPGAAVAPDSDLDGKYGDPEVRLNPRDWTGDSCKGLHYSQCPAEFLDILASSLDCFASKSEKEGALTTNGKPKADYERKDAARARGWAVRVRNGKGKAAAPVSGDDSWAGDDGFN